MEPSNGSGPTWHEDARTSAWPRFIDMHRELDGIVDLTVYGKLSRFALLNKGVENLGERPQHAQVFRDGPLGLQIIQVQP